MVNNLTEKKWPFFFFQFVLVSHSNFDWSWPFNMISNSLLCRTFTRKINVRTFSYKMVTLCSCTNPRHTFHWTQPPSYLSTFPHHILGNWPGLSCFGKNLYHTVRTWNSFDRAMFQPGKPLMEVKIRVEIMSLGQNGRPRIIFSFSPMGIFWQRKTWFAAYHSSLFRLIERWLNERKKTYFLNGILLFLTAKVDRS